MTFSSGSIHKLTTILLKEEMFPDEMILPTALHTGWTKSV